MALVCLKKDNKWGVYQLDTMAGAQQVRYEVVLPPLFDSLGQGQLFTDEYSIAIINGKYGILPNIIDYPFEQKNTSFSYDKIIRKTVGGRDYIFCKQNGQWGLLHPSGYAIVPAVCNSQSDVPLIWLNEWYIPLHKATKKMLNADIVVPDAENGDGVFKFRKADSHLWGMVQCFSEKKYKLLIPPQFDSLRFFPFNATYTAVYKNGKVGIYLSAWSYELPADSMQSVPCEYDDYKRFTADGEAKLAMKKDGKWGWVDWLNGKPMSLFMYETTDELPYPYYTQPYQRSE